MTCVGLAAQFTDVAFLWHNVIGAVAVVIVGSVSSACSHRLDARCRRDTGTCSARAIVIVVLLLIVAWLVGDMMRSGRKRRGRR